MELRDLIVVKDPIRVIDIYFSKIKYSRHFFATYYIQKLSKGEKHKR